MSDTEPTPDPPPEAPPEPVKHDTPPPDPTGVPNDNGPMTWQDKRWHDSYG